MSRLTLLFWQLMVAVVALSLWQFLTTVPVSLSQMSVAASPRRWARR